MFKSLSTRLSSQINKLRGLGRLTENNIDKTLKAIRAALLEADVALSVTKDFIQHIRDKAIGQKVIDNVRPGDALIKIVQDELTHILGANRDTLLQLNVPAPMVIVMAGLQGSGKTTTSAKLAQWLKKEHKKSVLLTSTDIYRPAAIEQLEILSKQIDVSFFPSNPSQKPTKIAQSAIDLAKKKLIDIVIIDTAGRLHIDEKMMTEIKDVTNTVNPNETLLVIDSMMGQDAATVAKTFNETIPITGTILTKTDADSRGGAALSMCMITEKPIKFVGSGEHLDALESFHPSRVANRILGMGDIVSFVEEAQRKIDKKEAKSFAKKVKAGHRFDFNDFLAQLKQMKKMGGMQSLLGKLPMGTRNLPKAATAFTDDKSFVEMEAMINSMTRDERRFPTLLNGSRKRRIADGSGTNIQGVNKLLKQFTQMQKMLKRMKGDKMKKQLKHMRHQLPPELLSQLPPDWDKK